MLQSVSKRGNTKLLLRKIIHNHSCNNVNFNEFFENAYNVLFEEIKGILCFFVKMELPTLNLDPRYHEEGSLLDVCLPLFTKVSSIMQILKITSTLSMKRIT